MSGAISLFENLHIHNKIQTKISLLKRCHEQMKYFCNKEAKCLNTKSQSVHLKI